MIYVVIGQTGEYSGHQLWHVKACRYKASADRLAAELNQWCVDNGADNGLINIRDCPLDPQFQCDYTGTEYGVIEIPEEDDRP